MSGDELDPMAGISRIVKSLKDYKFVAHADPYLSCLPVVVPLRPQVVEGLVLCLDSDAVNDGRKLDPYVVVAHWECRDSTLLVARSYLSSTLRWRALLHARLFDLRRLAGIVPPPGRREPRMTKPVRHGI